MAQQPLKTLVFDKVDEHPVIAKLSQVETTVAGGRSKVTRSEIKLTCEEVTKLSEWLYARFQFLPGGR